MNDKQRLNEFSSIRPIGFTGIISQNSNMVIDKSYIEKGTSFINAYKNSNVILKDCGSPKPIYEVNENVIYNQTKQLSSEKDSIELPPWVHYKIKRFNSNDSEIFGINLKNKFTVYCEQINSDINYTVTNLRNNILNASYKNEYGDVIAPSNLMLEKTLNDNKINTSDITVTTPGAYILSGVESSIRAVWPLDNSHKDKESFPIIDNPLLNLHFVKRFVFPMENSSGSNIKINGIFKIDKFGDKFKTDRTTNLISDNTKKPIAKFVSNRPEYEIGEGGITSFYADNNSSSLKLTKYNEKYYFDGPILNDKRYICYYKNVMTPQGEGKILINDELGKETTFWFTFNNKVYNIFEYINSDNESFKNDLNILLEEYDFKNRFKKDINRFYIDTIRENTSKYNPNNMKENCYFLGFKNKFNSDSNISEEFENKIYYYDNNQIKLLDNELYNEFDKELFFPENIKFYKNYNYKNNSLIINSDIVSSIFVYNYKSAMSDDEKTNAKIEELKNHINDNKTIFDYTYSVSGNYNKKTNNYNIKNDNNFKNVDIEVYLNDLTDDNCIFNSREFNFKNATENKIEKIIKINCDATFNDSDCFHLTSSLMNEIDIGADFDVSFKNEFLENIYKLEKIKDKSYTEKNTIYNIKQTNQQKSIADSSTLFENFKKSETDMNFILSDEGENKFNILSTYIVNNVDLDETNIEYKCEKNYSKYSKIFEFNKDTLYACECKDKNDASKKYYKLYYYVNPTEGNVRTTTEQLKAPYLSDSGSNNMLIGFTSTAVGDKDGNAIISVPKVEKDENGNLSIHYVNEKTKFRFKGDNTYYTREFCEIYNFKDKAEMEQFIGMNFKNPVVHDNIEINRKSIVEGAILKSDEDKIKYIKDTIKDRVSIIYDCNIIDDDFIKNKLYNKYLLNNDIYFDIKNGSNDISNLTKKDYSKSTHKDIFNTSNNSLILKRIRDNYIEIYNKEIHDASLNVENQFKEPTSGSFNFIEDNHEKNAMLNSPYFNGDQKNNYKFSFKVNNFCLNGYDSNTTYNRTLFEENYDSINIYPSKLKVGFSIDPINSIVVNSGDLNVNETIEKGQIFLLNDCVISGELTDNLNGKEAEDKNIFNLVCENNRTILDVLSEGSPEFEDSKKYFDEVFFDGIHSYKFYNKINKDENSDNIKLICTNIFPNPDIYFNSKKIVISDLNDFSINGTYDKELNSIVYSLNSVKNIEINKNIILFYDKECKIPLEYDNNNGHAKKYLYNHDHDGRKISIQSDTTNSNKFEYLRNFVYLTNDVYEFENFNDWYDLDTYINYSYLNSNITSNNEYSIKLIGNTPYYEKNYMVLNNLNYINLFSNVKSESYNIAQGYDYLINGDEYNFSSLFDTSSSYKGYKTFSFNFMIPEKGWNELNNEMYSYNYKYNQPIISKDCLNNTDDISDNSKIIWFYGNFVSKYRNLKSVDGFDIHSIKDRYECGYYSVSFNANIVKTDRIENNEPKNEKIFSMTSINDSLNFSLYLPFKKENESENIYEIIRKLNIFSIDIKSKSVSNYKAQFKDLKLYIRYSESKDGKNNKLFLSFLTNNPNMELNEINEESLKKIDTQYLINANLVNNAVSGFINKIDNDIIESNSVLKDPDDINEFYAELNEFSKYKLSNTELKKLQHSLTEKSGMKGASFTIEKKSQPNEKFEFPIDFTPSDKPKEGENLCKVGNSIGKIILIDPKKGCGSWRSCSELWDEFYINSISCNDVNLSSFNFKNSNHGNFSKYLEKLFSPDNNSLKGIFTYNGTPYEISEMVGKGNSFNIVDYYQSNDKIIFNFKTNLNFNETPGKNFIPDSSNNSYLDFCNNVINESFKSAFNYEFSNDELGSNQYLPPTYIKVNDGSNIPQCEKDGMWEKSGKNNKKYAKLLENYYNTHSEKEFYVHSFKTYKFSRINLNKINLGGTYIGNVSSTYSFSIEYSSTWEDIESNLITYRGLYDFNGNKFITNEDAYNKLKIYKFIYGNIFNNRKSSDDYFINWISPFDMHFISNDDETKYNSFISELSKISTFNGTISNYFCIDGSINTSFKNQEKFSNPHDISTNLFYYKGSTSEDYLNDNEIKKSDEIVIVNARKMYNEMDEEEPKPIDGSIDLNMKNLYDKPIVLTAYIDLTKGEQFKEIFPYVNNKFEYMFSEECSDNQSISLIEGEKKEVDEYKRVRYTDMLENSPQWKIYKLNKNIIFKTLDDFKINVTPDVNGLDDTNIGKSSNNDFEIPCSMGISFDNLLFKQKLRQGISFDNVEDIDFSSKILDSSVIENNNNDILNLLKFRWGLDGLSKDNYIEPILSGNVPDDKWLSTSSPISGYNKIGFLTAYSTGRYNKLPVFGTNEFYNDVQMMVRINNSVNKWESTSVDSKYSKLRVFSDYTPRLDENSHCVGSPYLNMKNPITLKIYDESGSGDSYYQTGELAKIATDTKYVNNIKIPKSDIYENDLYPENAEISTKDNIIEINDNDIVYGCTLLYSFKNCKVDDLIYRGFKKIKDIKEDTNSNNYVNDRWFFGIYFDGLLNEKDVIINSQMPIFKKSGKPYRILSIIKNEILLREDKLLTGKILFQIEEYDLNDQNNNLIEIHNVKPLPPTISKMTFSFNDKFKNGYKCNNELWQRTTFLNDKKEFIYNEKDQPYFSLQTNEDIKGSSLDVYDKNGKLIGISLTLELKGFRKFKLSDFKYQFRNPKEVVLSTQILLDDYLKIKDAFKFYKTVDNSVPLLLDGGVPIENYKNDAKLGDTIISGDAFAEYNHVETTPFDTTIKGIGSYKHTFNPIDKDLFQIEIITKNKDEDFKKNLFYTNLPVDVWYNLSIFKYSMEDKNKNEINSIGISLTNINGEKIEDVTNKSKEIFNVFTSNKKILVGTKINSNINSKEYFLNKYLVNFKKDYNIDFDPCSRYSWNKKYYTNTDSLSNSNNLTEFEYEKINRCEKDLVKLSRAFNDLKFSNKYSKISLFNNSEVKLSLNKCIFDKDEKNINSPIFISYNPEYKDYNSINSNNPNLNKDIKDYLINYIPIKVNTGNDGLSRYILCKKDKIYHVEGVNGIKAKSIMWVSSPDFSSKNNQCKYFDSINESLDMIKSYIKYFGNPQNKMPAVNYENRILNSDYATLIYNSCKKTKGIQKMNYVNEESYDNEFEVYDYKNSPTTIAYVWDNSKITRNETFDMSLNKKRNNKLHWVKQQSEEYVSEIGSLYNFKNSDTILNNITIEQGSIVNRQTTIMPVMTSPFDFEKQLNNVGIVTVNDKIIATSALGYNSNGYPINGVMVYNSNESVNFDLSQTTYLYIAQNNNQAECKFGATQEKPIYVDTVQENVAAYSEKFEFLPKFYNSNLKDAKETEYYGGNLTDDENITFDIIEKNEFGICIDPIEHILAENDLSDKTYEEKLEIAKNDYKNIKSIFSRLSYQSTIKSILTYSKYNYLNNKIDFIQNSKDNINVRYISNVLGSKSESDSVQNSTFNVFSDINDNNNYWETLKCFYFDGKLIPEKIANNNYNLFLNHSNYYESDICDDIKDMYLLNKNYNIEIEPSMAIIWGDKNITDKTYENYVNDINTIFNEKTGVAIFDSYNSCNLTNVKLTINEKHLINAPIYIKIYLLKAEKSKNGNINLVWKHDNLFDIDLRSTYDIEYDDKISGNKEINHQFILFPGKEDLIKNVFGIKFVIKEIMPQNNNNNSCIIDNIKVYASNITNKYGQAVSVEDIFVRKRDANCRNFYNMRINEYNWRLPNNVQEWKELETIFSDDVQNESEKYIDKTAWKNIEGVINNLTTPYENNTEINDQFNNTGIGNNFSTLNAYYITDGDSNKNVLNEIVSDNYLSENQNMSITWKYVDYVYIYYNSYSAKANFLLNKNFSREIYKAVKSKLNSNIKNLNANSAFKDRFKFSGGIAVSKKDFKNEKVNENIFDWSSSSSVNELWRAGDVQESSYELKGQKTTSANTKKIESTLYNGNESISERKISSKSSSNTQKGILFGTVITETTTNVNLGITEKTNVVIENPKFKSVDNWTSSFEPIMIKYKIN